jgi:hypothetical protein
MTYKSDWTDAEVALVQKHYNKLPVRELAAMLGRNKNQVIGKAGRLKLSISKPSNAATLRPGFDSGKKWTDAALEQLTEFWNNGTARRQIAFTFGVSENAISTAVKRLGLPERVPAVKPKPVISLAPIPKPVPLPVRVDNKPVTLEHRTGCCYPMNDGGPFTFCNNPGKQRGESIHCDPHWELMHSRPSQHHGKAVITAHRTTYR